MTTPGSDTVEANASSCREKGEDVATSCSAPEGTTCARSNKTRPNSLSTATPLGGDPVPASQSSGEAEGSIARITVRSAQTPHYPIQYERHVYERFAGGAEAVELFGTEGAAMIVAAVATTLEGRGMAIKGKLTTGLLLRESGRGGRDRGGTGRPRGGSQLHSDKSSVPSSASTTLSIILHRHPSFIGCNLEADVTTFLAPAEGESFTSIYAKDARETTVSLNAGDETLGVGGTMLNAVFASTLSASGLNVESFGKLHEQLLQKGLRENDTATHRQNTCAVEAINIAETAPGVKVALGRLCPELMHSSASGSKATGSCFLTIFAPEHAPYEKSRNVGMLYVVGPKGEEFEKAEEFLNAVRLTAANACQLMVDYNTMSRPTPFGSRGIEKVEKMRIQLFSGGVFKHPDASKLEVAKSIIRGWCDAYRWKLAPRVEFAYDDDCFKQAWEAVAKVSYEEALKNGNPYRLYRGREEGSRSFGGGEVEKDGGGERVTRCETADVQG